MHAGIVSLQRCAILSMVFGCRLVIWSTIIPMMLFSILAKQHCIIIIIIIYLICQKDRVAPKGLACTRVLPTNTYRRTNTEYNTKHYAITKTNNNLSKIHEL